MIEVRDENGFGHKNYSELRVNIYGKLHVNQRITIDASNLSL